MSTEVFVPASALPHRTPRELLALARHGLDEVADRSASARYATAHLSALRCAAAVIAVRARPLPAGIRRPRSRPASVWVTLMQVAPELGEWASFFATAAIKRAAAEAGLPRVISDQEADAMLRDAERFYDLIATSLGMSAGDRSDDTGEEQANA